MVTKKGEANSTKTSLLSFFELIQRHDGVLLPLGLQSTIQYHSLFVLTSKLDLEDKSSSAKEVATGKWGEVS